MNRRTPVLFCALAVLGAWACSESGNHTTTPGGSASVTAGSAGTPASVVVSPVASCSDAPAPAIAPGDADPLCMPASNHVSFVRDVAPLVGCTGEACHAPWTYSSLVGRRSLACCDMRPIVDPFHPSTSHLVQAVSDTDSCVGRMGQLEAPAVATIVAWICEGAPDD